MNRIEKQAVNDDDLALINQYTRKQLTADEVYTFSVVLCDNDIDRDFEYFTADTLEKLAEMFVGVTGIFDHNPTAKNQVARIYSCGVENLSPQKTAYGADYVRLVGKAYLPVCEGSRDIIAMIDSGIQKEVSVGCGIEDCRCSVCGEDMRLHECGHVKGEKYGGVVCCGVLENPTDAYEWSFTAVPAQKRAGVIKSFLSEKDFDFEEDFLKKSYGGDFTVSREEIERLKSYVDGLREKAEEGGRYKAFLELEAVKSGITAKLGIDSDLLESMVKGLNVEQLVRLKDIFEKKAAEVLPVRSQVAGVVGEFGERRFEVENGAFSI